MAKFCIKCGAPLDAGAKFCIKCGTKVDGALPKQTAPKKEVTQKPVTPEPPPQTPPPPPVTPAAAVAPAVVAAKPKSNIAIKIAAVVIVAVVIVAVFYVGFMLGGQKETGPQGTEDYGVVMGRVSDTNGNPLGDVTVIADGQPVETNDQGWFSISNVDEGDRVPIEFQRDGYSTTYRFADVQTGESSFIDATVSQVDTTDSFSASVGGTVTTSEGGSVTVGTYALEDTQGSEYSGTAEVELTTFDPSVEEEANAFPGEYLGINLQGQSVPLKSFGFMDITITDSSGNQLQLQNGESATIRIPVPASMQSDASSMGSCPLWYYDTDDGIWREEGSGTYDSGDFVGTITHLSTWNFDVAYPRAYISGRVVDGNGVPVQGAVVNCWGTGWKYSRWASGETSTAVDGTFTRIPVECTVLFNYQASKGGHESYKYTIDHALECDEEYNVGDIILESPSAQITLIWGENPRDLDSHLAATLSDDTFHVYYSDKGSLTSEPYTDLDTDDTTSYGPEVVSIAGLRQGTYRYSVRHYAGTGDIETSGAEVNVIIQGVGIYKFTPPSGQSEGTDIWRVLDIVVGSSGIVTQVKTINDYVEGGDSSELLYP